MNKQPSIPSDELIEWRTDLILFGSAAIHINEKGIGKYVPIKEVLNNAPTHGS